MKTLTYLLVLSFKLVLGGWQDGVQIKSTLRRDELDKLGSFEGHPDDHLTLVSTTQDNLYLGARNALFNFTISSDLINFSTLNWTEPEDYHDTCQIKGQSEQKCHNFVRVFHGPVVNPLSPDLSSPSYQYLVCGTNAFKPTCRWYSNDLKSVEKEFSGVGYTPFDPTHPSTTVLHHGSVYAATVADFGATDSLIYKQPLRTEQNFDLHLNSPSFVSSLSFGDLALFFFREAAVEHANCGKAVFSRVARICRHDNGSRKHDRFTTFLKARLNCSVPGEYPFYFDHIQGTTDIFMNDGRREEMLYAVFTTPPNSIGASAVCSFYTKDILKAFDGPFKGQSSITSNWLPVPDKEVPKPRPGQCSNDPNHQPDSNSVAFLKGHPLMDEAVEGQAVLTYTSNDDKFVSIAVDYSPEIAPYHIIYIGTNSGKVLKAVVNGSGDPSTSFRDWKNFDSATSVISQSWEVFPSQQIKSLKLLSSNRLVVLTEREMNVIRVDNCDKFSSCSKCITIRDPHCGWDKSQEVCVRKNGDLHNNKKDSTSFIQDVGVGDSQLCPIDEHTNEIIEANHLKSIIAGEEVKVEEECCACTTSTTASTTPGSNKNDIVEEKIIIQVYNQTVHDNEIPRLRSEDKDSAYVLSSTEGLVSSQSVILATTSSAVLCLFIGFSMGFLVSKWIESRSKKSQSSTNSQLTATLNESQRLTKPKEIKPIDFVVNVPTSNKSPIKNNLNTDTIEKTVKKIYI